MGSDERALKMSPRSAGAAIGIVVVLLIAACSSDGADNDDTDSATPVAAGDPAAGEQVYGDYCGACHGRDFQGSPQGPSHLDPHFDPATTTDADYRDSIRNGADESVFDFGDMPAIASLSDQQVADVIAYIRSVQEERGFDGT